MIITLIFFSIIHVFKYQEKFYVLLSLILLKRIFHFVHNTQDIVNKSDEFKVIKATRSTTL